MVVTGSCNIYRDHTIRRFGIHNKRIKVGRDEAYLVRLVFGYRFWRNRRMDKAQRREQNQYLSVHQSILHKGFWKSYWSELRMLYLFGTGPTLVKKFSTSEKLEA